MCVTGWLSHTCLSGILARPVLRRDVALDIARLRVKSRCVGETEARAPLRQSFGRHGNIRVVLGVFWEHGNSDGNYYFITCYFLPLAFALALAAGGASSSDSTTSSKGIP